MSYLRTLCRAALLDPEILPVLARRRAGRERLQAHRRQCERLLATFRDTEEREQATQFMAAIDKALAGGAE